MTPFTNVSRADIDAGIARGRQLRSRQLDDLPDYLLKDIGIERHQIPALAAGTLRRQKSSLAAAYHRIAGIFQPRPETVEAANDRRRLAA
jgi:hypothetical protein